ncbi:MAG: hypothetical protein HOP25_08150 [Methylotenera sp.]|nr:hypothetical protein [Methylotenera sp.]
MAKFDKTYNNISADDLRFLLCNVDVFNKEVEDFTPWLNENQKKLFSGDLNTIAWAPLYELSFNECLLNFFLQSGLTNELVEIVHADNKIHAAYHFHQNLDQTIDKVSAGLSEEQRPSYILNTLCYGVVMMKNAHSLMVFGHYINDLVAIARSASDSKSRDEALFKAIRIDASVVCCQTALSRISKAVLLNDAEFMKALNNAIAGKLGAREDKTFKKMRFILQALHESGGINFSDKELVELFVKQLKLVSDTKFTSEKNIGEFARNFKNKKSTI